MLVFLLLSTPAFSAVCSDYHDCPVPKCPGSIRMCDDGVCLESECMFIYEEKPSTLDAFKDFELALNVTLIEDEAEFNGGILAAFGIQNVFSGLGIAVMILVMAFLMILLLIFLKSKSKLMFAIGLAFIILLIGLFAGSALTGDNMFRKIFFFGEDWDSHQLKNFYAERIPEEHVRVSSVPMQALDEVSTSIQRAKTYLYEKSERPTSLTIIEFYSADSVRELPEEFIGKVDSTYDVLGERLFKTIGLSGVRKYIWDEDRFVFIIQSLGDDIDRYAEKVIRNYPQKPTKTLLKVTDSQPPIINILTPAPGSISHSPLISFELFDSLTGINIDSVSSNLGYMRPFNDCSKREDGSFICRYSADLDDGVQTLNVSVWDNYGNYASESIEFIVDTGRPALLVWPPKYEITTENRFMIEASDEISGIDADSIDILLNSNFIYPDCLPGENVWICQYYDKLVVGKNVLEVTAKDRVGNNIVLKQTIEYDPFPPKIISKIISRDFEGGVEFIISDEGSGVLIDDITANVADFNAQTHCLAGNPIICKYNGTNISLFVSDRAGLKTNASIIFI